MRQSLVDMGVPIEKIKEDYAGFRTLDSVVRAKEVFGQSSVTIISQKFHNERAVFLAKNKGVDAIAYNAKEDAQLNFLSVKNHIREYFARVNAVLDLLIEKKPKFLGPSIEIK
jgi:SanA protein